MCLILLLILILLKILIDSFTDFLVDQARQFQNTPNFRIDSFRFFLDIYSPLHNRWLKSKERSSEGVLCIIEPQSTPTQPRQCYLQSNVQCVICATAQRIYFHSHNSIADDILGLDLKFFFYHLNLYLSIKMAWY